MEQNELSFATKVKIVSWMSLAALLFMVVVGGVVTYQRNAKIEAAELAKTQLANVEAMKTAFPDFRDSKQFKERVKMAIVKVPIADLPTTVTAGLDETVDPNPSCSAVNEDSEVWQIFKNGNSVAFSLGATNGWSVSPGGEVSIPADAVYGKYTVTYASGETCDEGAGPGSGYLKYYYVFKITPPCPTSVGLIATP